MTQTWELELAGCRPEPLMSYLKALGALRLISEQIDSEARGYLKDEVFHLRTAITEEQLISFFMDKYRPTPILAPWNGASGFWDKTTAYKALSEMAASTNPRLTEYRQVIMATHQLLAKLQIATKPDKVQKPALMQAARSWLPDSAICWLDAAYILGTDKPKYPALLGTGGNDGKLDFTSNFIQNILQVIPKIDSAKVADSLGGKKPKARKSRPINRYDEIKARLELALFQRGAALLVDTSVGQFHPGGVGGPNGLQGFEAPSLVNPWDFILMIEGTLFFAGAATWRFGGTSLGQAGFPFTVRSSLAGWGTLAERAGQSSRAEVWLPLWRQPADLPELLQLFGEGRAQIGRAQAKNGVEFARAIAELGVDRGIESFQRYGFLQRSGKAYLAAPLGRMAVRARPAVGLIREVDPWLDSFRRLSEDETAPASCRRALKGIEDSVFVFCLRGGRRGLQDVLVALGRGEQALAHSRKLHDRMRPLQGLSPRWLRECDDGSIEFRLAVALASIDSVEVGPLRVNLEPLEFERGKWKWGEENPGVVWGGGDLTRNLATVLERRLLEFNRKTLDYLPIPSHATAGLEDIHRFLLGQVDDRKIGDLVWALSVISWPNFKATDWPERRREIGCKQISRAYALLKLLFLPHPIKMPGNPVSISVRTEPAIMARLRGGDLEQAMAIAIRRLRAEGLMVLASSKSGRIDGLQFVLSESQKRRLLASLLIPVEKPEALANLVIEAPRVTA